jgi:8-oxo-dGTP pyrophosphatase MutT (NUDIX family)
MKIIKTIRDEDIGSNIPDPAKYKEREAARAIVLDTEHKVALLHATNVGYHKLPGGGIEAGEDIVQALKREAIEEIGCDIGNIRELGKIEEYRNGFGLHQISYCFVADLIGKKGKPNLEEGEIADGFETEWLPLAEAIQILESEATIEHYEGRFIQLRALTFLKEAASII